MSALPFGSYIRPSRPFFESGAEPMTVSSIVGVSSINGTLYPPVAGLPTFLPSVEITRITGLSTINDVAYPPAGGSGPLIQSGSFGLSNNGQVVEYPVPYTSTVSVVVQGTANAAGVNGFFTIATYGSKSQFQTFYSGELIYGPIEMFWIASGV